MKRSMITMMILALLSFAGAAFAQPDQQCEFDCNGSGGGDACYSCLYDNSINARCQTGAIGDPGTGKGCYVSTDCTNPFEAGPCMPHCVFNGACGFFGQNMTEKTKTLYALLHNDIDAIAAFETRVDAATGGMLPELRYRTTAEMYAEEVKRLIGARRITATAKPTS